MRHQRNHASPETPEPMFALISPRFTRWCGRRARRGSERGAVLIETSIVGVLLTLLAFGALEYGLLLHQADDTADMVRVGSRTAAFSGTDDDADFQILSAMKTADQGLGGGIDAVVIFKSDNNGQPSSTCANFQVDTSCNVYSGAELDNLAPYQTNPHTTWAPAARTVGDYVGIKVRSKYTMITKLFGSEGSYTDASVVQLAAPQVGVNGGVPGFSNGSTTPPVIGGRNSTCDSCSGNGSSGSGPGGR